MVAIFDEETNRRQVHVVRSLEAPADCLGLFEKTANRERVVVLLEPLGRKVRVEAPLTSVSVGA